MDYSYSDIARILQQQGDAFTDFKSEQDRRITHLEAKAGRPHIFGNAGNDRTEERKSLTAYFNALCSGDQAKANKHLGEIKSMSVGSDPDGGYLVTPTLSTDMTRIKLEISPFSGWPGSGNRRRRLRRADRPRRRRCRVVGEVETRGETDTSQLGNFRCELHELQAEPKVTQKLVDTARVNIVDWLSGQVAEKFAYTETDAYFNGNGVKRPRGFLTYTTAATGDATRTWGQLEHVKTGVNGAFAAASTSVNPADHLIDLKSKLKTQYKNGAVFLMNRSTAAAVRKLKDPEGRWVWVNSLQAGQPDMLLGHPVIECEQMPDIATDSLSIAFGSFKKGYTIIRRLGVRFLLDPFTAKPYIKLYTFTRVGGSVNNFEAIKFLKFSA
jgi:HK97 family phage major capsid protein